jgi:hypothetical protein
MKKIYFFVLILAVTFSAYGAEEKPETPFEYNLRWYKNDFKWWNVWHKEFYKSLGKDRANDAYNAGQVINSIKKLRRWVVPQKAGLFESFIEFYETIKEKVKKDNLRRPAIRKIKTSLKGKRKEFTAEFHFKNIKPEEWIRIDIVDKSAFEKVETMSLISPYQEKSGYRYIAHRYGRIFHKSSCDIAEDIKENDRIYFKTKRRAFSTNRKSCRECKP